MAWFGLVCELEIEVDLHLWSFEVFSFVPAACIFGNFLSLRGRCFGLIFYLLGRSRVRVYPGSFSFLFTFFAFSLMDRIRE